MYGPWGLAHLLFLVFDVSILSTNSKCNEICFRKFHPQLLNSYAPGILDKTSSKESLRMHTDLRRYYKKIFKWFYIYSRKIQNYFSSNLLHDIN